MITFGKRVPVLLERVHAQADRWQKACHTACKLAHLRMSTPPSSVHFPAADDADNVDIPADNWGLKNKKSQLSTARYKVEGGDSSAEKSNQRNP